MNVTEVHEAQAWLGQPHILRTNNYINPLQDEARQKRSSHFRTAIEEACCQPKKQ